MADDETKSTPKRKRDMGTPIAPIAFSFDPTRTADDGDGSSSPRSRVAHRFRGLALGGGGGGGGSGVASRDDDDDAARKRQRADAEMTDVPASTVLTVTDAEGKTVPQPQVAEVTGKPAEARLPSGSLQKTYPSINRLSESKSRKGRRRTGTPPPRLRKKAAEAGGDAQDDDEMEIVDPVRAALTWHEDEITIYDPDDADDDGTGINGIGFRPTPAMAHARLMKRRQQMAEYRRREESEARERRSQRRHGQQQQQHHHHVPPSSSSPEQSPRRYRKVKFMEDDNRTYLSTTTS